MRPLPLFMATSLRSADQVVRALALLALTLGSGSTAGFAQSPRPETPLVVEAEIELVSLTAVVHDSAGKPIHGLTAADVLVLEDARPQQLTYFREASGASDEKIPLSVVLVLDASGSMKHNLHFLQEAALRFVDKLESVDTALVVQFNESIKGSADFTGDPERLEQFVEAMQAWGGTSLYDAVHYGLERIRDKPGRKAIIVFSDGDDTTSSVFTEQGVIDYARSAEATVYCVAIRGMSLLAHSPRGFLKRVAAETGGSYFSPDRVGDLIKVFSLIADELHNHYVLAYKPQRAPDGTWRETTLRLLRKDLKNVTLRVRKGYFAVKRRPARGRP